MQLPTSPVSNLLTPQVSSFGRSQRWWRCLSVALSVLLCAMVVLSYTSTTWAASSAAAVKRSLSVETRAVRTATNGILTVQIEDSGTEIGQFTIRTGARHPHPNQTVFFPIGTSYITLRDATANIMWVNNSSTPSPGLAGYTVRLMSSQPSTVTNLGTTGFRTTYTLPSFRVVQDVTINGTSLANTNVLQLVRITNTSTGARAFGLRYLWDWQIAGNDASFFRTRNPNGSFTNVFTTFNNPRFPIYEEVDNTTSPTFSIFGTVGGGGLRPVPTQPDQVRYCAWGDAFDSAWDFPNTGSGRDSAVTYFWGFNTPRQLAAGATASFAEYVTTVLSAVAVPTPTPTGGGPTPTPVATPTPTPTPPSNRPPDTPVAAGGGHSLAVSSNGTVLAWGYNGAGQLGDGTRTSRNTPVRVVGLTGVRSVAAGWYHSLALRSDGTVFAWGFNQSGQLGNGSNTNSSVPVRVHGLDNIMAIAAGVYHSLALRNDGTVWAWGNNFYGQLGNGSSNNSNVPVQVAGISGASSISAGGAHSVAVVNGGVQAWGWNAYGQLGDGTTNDSDVPVAVSGLSAIGSVAAGFAHTLALAADEDGVAAWGNNAYGQLGNGSTRGSATPVSVSGLQDVHFISAGAGHSVAVLSDGTLMAWGINNFGQLGNGATSNSPTPVIVHGFNNAGTFTSTQTPPSAGYGHTVASGSGSSTVNASLWAWGYNQFGQLGNNSNENSSTPVPVGQSLTSSVVARSIPNSTAAASTGVARAATGTVQITFSTSLDNLLASSPINYAVTVNGRQVSVETAAYNASTRAVTLALPGDALRAGDQVKVGWHGLADARGNLLADGSWQGTAG